MGRHYKNGIFNWTNSKYVEGYGVFPFAGKFGDKYGKKLRYTATKTKIDAVKTASKKTVQKNSRRYRRFKRK